MISLYDYLGRPAGSALGKEIYIYAKSVKANIGEKIVSISPYKNGLIRTYEKEFLDKYFETYKKNKS